MWQCFKQIPPQNPVYFKIKITVTVSYKRIVLTLPPNCDKTIKHVKRTSVWTMKNYNHIYKCILNCCNKHTLMMKQKLFTFERSPNWICKYYFRTYFHKVHQNVQKDYLWITKHHFKVRKKTIEWLIFQFSYY